MCHEQLSTIAINDIRRKQDEEYTRKRQNMIATLRKPTKSLTAKTAGSQVTRTRSYSTLMNPTKIWSERCKMQDPGAKEPRKLQYIKDVPRLYVCVCEWNFPIYTYKYLKNRYFAICYADTSNGEIKSRWIYRRLPESSIASSSPAERDKDKNEGMEYWYILMFIFLYERTFVSLRRCT